MTNLEDESNDNSLDGGVTNPDGRPPEHDEMSLGDEGTLGDKLGDQEPG